MGFTHLGELWETAIWTKSEKHIDFKELPGTKDATERRPLGIWFNELIKFFVAHSLLVYRWMSLSWVGIECIYKQAQTTPVLSVDFLSSED